MDQDTIKWLIIDRDYSYLMVAIATCVIYDQILTIGREVEYVWARPNFSVVQALFFSNRYLGAVLQIYPAFVLVRHIVDHTEKSCDFLNIFVGYVGSVVLCSCQGISVYRISSIYNHSRKVVALLLGAFIVEFTSIIVIQCIAHSVHDIVPEPAPNVHLCKETSFPRWSGALWIPVLGFELITLALALAEAVRYHHSRKLLRHTSLFSQKHSLLFVLLRQSITFQLLGIVFCIPDVIAWYRLPYLSSRMTFSLVLGFGVLISSRLVINLREAYYQPFEQEITQALYFADDDDAELSLSDIPDIPSFLITAHDNATELRD